MPLKALCSIPILSTGYLPQAAWAAAAAEAASVRLDAMQRDAAIAREEAHTAAAAAAAAAESAAAKLEALRRDAAEAAAAFAAEADGLRGAADAAKVRSCAAAQQRAKLAPLSPELTSNATYHITAYI